MSVQVNVEKGGRVEYFKFDLNTKVMIKELQRPGRVESMLIDGLGVQYRVAFWDNAERQYAWLNVDELEAR